MAKWHVRYVAWATSQGRSAEAQFVHDKKAPGLLVEFKFWIQARWVEWRQIQGLKPRGIDHDDLTPEQCADFDAWVQTRAVELAGAAREEVPRETR